MIDLDKYARKIDIGSRWTSPVITKKIEEDLVKLPLGADVYITDCERQDFKRFGGQYVWTVRIKIWRGPHGYYPHLGDEQFDCSFDIPADWVTDGWDVSTNSQLFGGDVTQKQRQQMKAVAMNADPVVSAPWLIKRAVQRGILESPVLELL